ncbi:MAG: NrpR regulatory domain-containing protein [Candidatus Margulisiibacteriota bacterium]
MKEIERRNKMILKLIAEAKTPIGSVELAAKLKEFGLEVPERTVRYYLKSLGDQGLVKIFWKEGRMITSKGREELSNAHVSEKIGLVSSRIESLAYQMDFDIHTRKGRVILNVSLFNAREFKKAIELMKPVFENKLSMGELVLVVEAGEEIGGIIVPPGKVGFGTLCTINLNGILLKHAIPVVSRFGGMLQIEEGRPLRFTDIIDYSGSTLDPHEIFLKSQMTSVNEAIHGAGKVLAGFREIPAASRDEAEATLRRIEAAGLGTALVLGKSGQTVLGMPVAVERVGLVVAGGLNPVAAAEEAGLETESRALVSLIDHSALINYRDL